MTKSSVIVNIPPPPPPPPRRPHNIYGVNPAFPINTQGAYYTISDMPNLQVSMHYCNNLILMGGTMSVVIFYPGGNYSFFIRESVVTFGCNITCEYEMGYQ